MKITSVILPLVVNSEFTLGDGEESPGQAAFEIDQAFDADMFESNMGSSGTIDFKQPEPDSEAGGEQNMPLRHRCDACRIIGLKMNEHLDKKVNLYPSIRDGKKELTESQILEVLEDVCDNMKTWDSIGAKVIHGVERLSAPGFETAEIPGVTQGGMKWPWRFKTHCNMLLEEMGEDEIYDLYRDESGKLIYEMCYNGKKKDCVRYPTAAVPKRPNSDFDHDEL